MATIKNKYKIAYVMKGTDGSLPNARDLLSRIEPIAEAIRAWSVPFEDWLLAGDSIEEASRHPVYEDGQPTEAAVAVVAQWIKKQSTVPGVAMWNGITDAFKSMGINYYEMQTPHRGHFSLSAGPKSFSDNWQEVAKVMAQGALMCRPLWGSVESHAYYPKRVFPDRPAVGWMFYLPTTLTGHEVPEARAVHPVMDGKTQIGTILVSVTDAPFDHDAPEHVRVANEIEMRLANIDLLPRF